MKKLGKKLTKKTFTVQQYACSCYCPCFQNWASNLSSTAAYNKR